MTRLHSFSESLRRSQAYEDAPWWFEVYRRAFPDLKAAVSVRADGWAQRGGIDRVLTLGCGKTLTVNEKVREKVYQDILLERFSDEAAKAPGWIQKKLACDYIAYAFVPITTCYLLPTLTLQRAWQMHGRKWISEYRPIRAHNERYVTLSVGVPIEVLFKAINDAMRVCWDDAPAKPTYNKAIEDVDDLPLFARRKAAE